MNPLPYFVAGTFLLSYVILQMLYRLRRPPLAIQIAKSENGERNESGKKKRRYNSFQMRAYRANWDVPKGYQNRWMLIGVIAGGIVGYMTGNLVWTIGCIVGGMFYPFYQLRSKEKKFQSELPLRAEQAINAIEQQMTADIPIFHAIKEAIPYMQSPIKEEYARAIEKVEKASIPLGKALEEIPKRLQLPQLEYFHMIVEVAEETEERAESIIQDASDLLRRRQQYVTRFERAVSESRREMKMMFGLVVVMVLSFTFMLPDNVPIAGGLVHRVLDVVVIGLSAWITWAYLKKLDANKLF